MPTPAYERFLSYCSAVGCNDGVVLDRNSPEWLAWQGWHIENGIGTAFMDRQAKWAVPHPLPPQLGVDDLPGGVSTRLKDKFK